MANPAHTYPLPDNVTIARALERIADLLDDQRANPYRVQAYRTAAESVRGERAPLAEQVIAEGTDALERLRGIGPRISRHIDTFLYSGRIPLLEQLEGEASPERLLASVPGIGPKSAHDIHTRLAVDSLEDLELATHDGRLEELPGFGPRRIEGLRHTLGHMLGERARLRARPGTAPRPPVSVLLELDSEYRNGAAAGRLPKIAPRRFNPAHEAWLPVLHDERAGWSLTATYSNTARAHQLRRVRDWVVIFYEHDDIAGQYTVVTEAAGALAGRRVVRGREPECLNYYGVEPTGEGSGTKPAPPTQSLERR